VGGSSVKSRMTLSTGQGSRSNASSGVGKLVSRVKHSGGA
jgi:hypothetical protein